MRANFLQPCPTLCDPMNCSPPGSSVHRILQARILEWVAMPSSRESSPPRDQTHISFIGRWILYHRATCEGDTLSYSSKSDKNKLCCSNWFFWGTFQMSTTDTESYDFCYFSCFKLTSIYYYHFIP